MLIEQKAFDTATATPVADDHAPEADTRKGELVAFAVLGAYLLSLVAATAIWGGFGTLAWALVSVPLAGIWVIYLTWAVPD